MFDPSKISYDELLDLFWTNHDPTQGMRQDIDIGTQYRSAVYYYSEQQADSVQKSMEAYQQKLDGKGLGKITTEIKPVEKTIELK